MIQKREKEMKTVNSNKTNLVTCCKKVQKCFAESSRNMTVLTSFITKIVCGHLFARSSSKHWYRVWGVQKREESQVQNNMNRNHLFRFYVRYFWVR